MSPEEFRSHAHQLVDWMADYLGSVGEYPVKPNVKPGDIRKQLPAQPPVTAESFDAIFKDFKDIIVPGMTHWQHPQFFAYFPSGSSEASILGEMLATTLGAQCMIWLTSPAAEELEHRMMEWLRDATGLPSHFTGVIQDSSSSSTLVALLTAREWKSKYAINQSGFNGDERFRVYTSTQAHSSVDKDVRIAGLGIDNLVKVGTEKDFAMSPEELEAAIIRDKAQGFTPLCVVSTIGTTSSTAIDPISAIGDICARHECWHHIDASYAGSALLCPELRWMSKGVEKCDSFVFNPHKWMFTHFDCSAYFVKDKQALINTFSIMPEYLKTPEDKLVNNYRDWGIPLGRRFRALKLWFVIRSFGLEGMQQRLRDHIAYGQWVKQQVLSTPGFELMAPVPLNLVCFRIHPKGMEDEAALDEINAKLIQDLNASGKILLTQTKLDNKFVIRFVAGQTHATMETVKKGWELVREFAERSGGG
ncbi:MAG: aspartate aminotransferase family protein [Cyclobacteriaceae bacterium]|nr:aspartate aminotransferase family protein [Cyclobacteriaceae bacterium]